MSDIAGLDSSPNIQHRQMRLRTGRGGAIKPVRPIDTLCGEVVEEEPLSPIARVFLEPAMKCCIIVMLGSKTGIDVGVVKEGLKHTLIKHPRFSSKLMVDAKKSGKKTWVRTQVNLDNHVVIPNLEPYVNSPDQIVEDYISKLTTVPIDMTKPLWEVHLLKIETSNANGVAVLKMHHSLGDGMSLVSFLLACTGKISDPNSLPSLPTKKTTKSSGRHQKGLLRLLSVALLVFRLFWNTTIHMLQFIATILFLKDSNTPIKGSSGTENNPKRIVHRTIKLDDIKLVKNEMDATVNDVMVGLVQAGLSCYLNRKYKNYSSDHVQEAKMKQHNIRNSLRVRACLLLNLRPSSGIQELTDMMEKGSKCRWGNKIGYILLPFYISSRDDPLDYISQARDTINNKKDSLEAMLTYLCSLFIHKIFGEKVVAALSHRGVMHTTLSFSNMVGPVEEISLFGHPVAYMAPTTYGTPQAVMIHCLSYANKMTIVVAVDETVVSDPHQLCQDIEASLNEIKNALQSRKLPTTKT